MLLRWACLLAQAADSSQGHWLDLGFDVRRQACMGTGAECVKKCIEGGMKPVFVDDTRKQVWSIDNPDAVKDFYGDHVTVKATEDAAKKSMHIDSIAAAK